MANPYDAVVDSVMGATNPYDSIVESMIPKPPPDTSAQDRQRYESGQMSPQEQQAYNQQQYASAGGGFRPLSGIGATADLAASGLSQAIVGLPAKGAASIGAILTRQNPQEARNFVDENMVYHPQTAEAQQVVQGATEAAQRGLAPVGRGINAMDKWGDKVAYELGGLTGQRALQTAGQVAGDVNEVAGAVGEVLPGVAVAKQMLGRTIEAARAAGLPQKLSRLEEFRQRGLNLRPSDVSKLNPTGNMPSVGGRLLEASVNSGVASQELSIANAPKFQAAAARAVGADLTATDGRFTPEVLDALKAPENAIYGELAAVPGEGTGAAYRATLKAIDTRGMSLKAAEDVNKLKRDYTVLGNSQSAVNDVRTLRERASKLIQSDSAEDNQVGFAMKKIADGIDDELAQRAGRAIQMRVAAPDLISRFQQARVQLAKLHTIEDSLRAETIDPKKVWQARQHGVPVNLDPDLKFIADSAEFAPGVSLHPQTFNVVAEGGVPHGKSGWLQNITRNIGGNAFLKGPYQRSLGPESTNLPSRVPPTRTGPPDITEGMSSSPPTAPPPGPRSPNSDLASVMAGDLQLGDYSAPELTLSPPTGVPPKSANFSPSEANRLAGDMNLAVGPPGPYSFMNPNLSDTAGVMSQGVPEDIAARTTRGWVPRMGEDVLPQSFHKRKLIKAAKKKP